MTIAPSVALNPLTWFHVDGGFHPELAPPLPEIYRQVKEAGFDAVHVEIPDGMGVDDYRRLLTDSGLEPAPGYFQGPFSDTGARAEVIENAKRAAGQHLALGLRRIFIAEQFGASPARLATPGIGADPDPDRLARISENLGAVAAAMTAEGVRPCLHQHVGTWIETESELQTVLDNTDPAALLLGPDTGHLAWAGADPAAVIARNLQRVGAVHLKDVHAAQVERAGRDKLDYMAATSPVSGTHLWTEPGNGDVDFAAVLHVLAAFDGWYVVEVDVADQPTPARTAAVSAAWIKEHLVGGRAR